MTRRETRDKTEKAAGTCPAAPEPLPLRNPLVVEALRRVADQVRMMDDDDGGPEGGW